MTKAIGTLVADAEAAIRRLLKGTFVRQGYAASEAETARQTLNALATIKPPALPDQDGIELVPRLKDSGSVVIILSECGQTENKVRALDQDAAFGVTAEQGSLRALFTSMRSTSMPHFQMQSEGLKMGRQEPPGVP